MEEKKKKIYISGAMRYIDEEESRSLFAEAKARLEELGYEAINPWDLEPDKEKKCKDWGDFLLYDLNILKTCDCIFMLRNWRDSDGARTEHDYAKGCGIVIIYQDIAEAKTIKKQLEVAKNNMEAEMAVSANTYLSFTGFKAHRFEGVFGDDGKLIRLAVHVDLMV